MKINKKRILNIILALVMLLTLIPTLGGLVSAAPADLTRAAVYTLAEGNIARMSEVRTYTATAGNVGINASYANSTNGAATDQVPRINDGALATSTAASMSWNSWNTSTFPVTVTITWSVPHMIDATRAMYWYDGTASSSGVTLPGNVSVQYWNGSAYVNVTNLRNPSGAAISYLGSAGGGTTNSNRTWNAATFDPVTTTRIRLSMAKGIGTGIGLQEWEIFEYAGAPELTGVSVSGTNNPVVSTTNTYTANVISPGLTGVTYEWSATGNIAVVGSNTNQTVQVVANNVGAGVLSVTARHSSGVQEATANYNINVQNISVAVSGEAMIPGGGNKVYTATASAGTLPVTYKWTLNNANATIVGSDTGNTVTVQGVAAGTVRITCAITNADRGLTASGYYDATVRVMGALDYIGGTAAGRAPILPRRVVVDGLLFDTPTASAVGNKSYNFAESFEKSLVPVVWDMNSFTVADYTADKIGTTFEVTGVTATGSRAPGLAAKAKFTVNEPLPAPDYNHSVTSENVIFENGFWAQRQNINATVTLDAAATQLAGSASYAERNFTNALGRLQSVWNGNMSPSVGTYSGYVFQDTDVYKTLEGYAYNLAAVWNSDTVTTARKTTLLNKAKSWINLIEQIQYADGYINSCFSCRSTTSSGGEGTGNWRWRYFARHEMYNIGHFLEAAVAYTRFAVATDQTDAYVLYEVGRRTADHIVNVFGPNGYRMEVPGHEEIELAMMKFATLCEEYEGIGTGQKYRDTVEALVDRRGRRTGAYARESTYAAGTYSQDATALVNETRAVGHAVRAMYFYTGATDVAISMPDSNPNKLAFLNGINNIYNSVSERNYYITGGLGSGESSEGFGPDWHIRNSSAYTETCAAIAGANWFQRLNLYYEDAKYADSYERALYNGVIVGVDLAGNRFAYGTGLDGSVSRGTWQGCACCPPNVLRTIANAGGYVYTVHNDVVFVNMYGESKGHVNVQGDDIKIDQVTQYPWEGEITMTVTPPVDKVFTLNLRLPGWVKAQKYQQVTLLIDGEEIDSTATAKGYIPITREWPATGTVITYNIPMEVRLTEADLNVSRVYCTSADHNPDSGQNDKVVVERGPMVYMVDASGVPTNNPPATSTTGRTANQVRLPRDMEGFQVVNRLSGSNMILRGVYTIEGYARYNTTTGARNQWIQLVPYYCKTNRGANPSNTANTTSSTGTDASRVWINATENCVLIRGNLNRIAIGGTVKLQANPKVNIGGYYSWYSGTTDNTVWRTTGASLNYVWEIVSGANVIELVGVPAATKTDDRGPGKIGGVGYTLDASEVSYKAIRDGKATVRVTMRNASNAVLATDTYDIDVTTDNYLLFSYGENIAQAIIPGQTLKVAAKFTGESNLTQTMIVALYSSNGKLVSLVQNDGVVDSKAIKFEGNLSIPAATEAGAYVRVFFWDTNTFVPLREAVDFPAINAM